MKSWNEIRTAATVARLGTVSAAASELGIHRASVNRHLETLERELGAKLFMRHRRGFTPTPLGEELLRIADATRAQFGELNRMARDDASGVEGIFKVTLVSDIVPVVLPILKTFREQNPAVELSLIGSDQILQLEYGEADVALRIGPRPDHPDNVVLPLVDIPVGFYGPRGFPMPGSLADLPANSVVGPGERTPKTECFKWLETHVPDAAVGLRSDRIEVLWDAVVGGYGVGFLPAHRASGRDLVELIEPRAEWTENVWLVTHVDMHRSPRVQAFIRAAKQTRL